MPKRLDPIGLMIVTLHKMLGHDKAAIVLGEAPYNKDFCILCRYEKGEVDQEAVYERLGV